MTAATKAPLHDFDAPPDRVRAHSGVPLNRRIDAETRQCIEQCAAGHRETIDRHVEAVDREWDIERYLQMNAGIVSLSGVLLGALVNPRFLVLPAAVFGFFLQHAVQGWCPPVPVFRRIGVRTRREINREKCALKALRGDFEHVSRESLPAAVTTNAPRRQFDQAETTVQAEQVDQEKW